MDSMECCHDLTIFECSFDSVQAWMDFISAYFNGTVCGRVVVCGLDVKCRVGNSSICLKVQACLARLGACIRTIRAILSHGVMVGVDGFSSNYFNRLVIN